MNRLLCAALALLPLHALADEGMWTFDAFPKEKVQRRYGFLASDEWLDAVRLASARLAGGCSASFVSPDGLVMTNHHCAQECIQGLSTARRDLFSDGYVARERADELRCPDVEVNQLLEIRDVTARVREATAGSEGEAYQRALHAVKARLERECQTSAELRCEVVTLHHGGVHDLYRYRRWQDVRLVFAPEFRIAFFGGDPDNFEFPRYDLDVSFLRVYEKGAPARTEHFFRWSDRGAQEGELTFVSGNPGGTSRQLTVAQLEYERDFHHPERLLRYAELRGVLTDFMARGPEERRIATETLFSYENYIKAYRGEWDALRDPGFFRALVAREEALRADVAKAPEGAREVLPAFDAIAGAVRTLRDLRDPLAYVESPDPRRSKQPAGFLGELFSLGRKIVRGAVERGKPDGERLLEFRESALPELTQEILSEAPIYPALEKVLLTHSLTKLRERLGADHPLVRKVLGKSSPEEVAARAVDGTRLVDPAERRRLWEGGAKVVEAASDPMLALVRLVEPEARAIRARWEKDVDAVIARNEERIAEARFAAQGRTTYPDATFTARLSYGQVKGWNEDGHAVAPFTNLGGAFERATGRDPYALPESWVRARPRLNPQVRFDFVTTNDIIGGNSGSPVVNRRGEIVGLVFDGNIHSLGGRYGFDESVNRTVAVHSDAILEALAKVYGADRIVRELRGKGSVATKR